MIREDLGRLIIEATKSRDSIRLQALKMIKSEYQRLQLSRPKDQEMTDLEEIKILQKMIEQRKVSAETYFGAGREDLATAELKEAEVIESFLPRELSDDEIRNIVEGVISGYGKISGMSDFKAVLGLVQKENPQIQAPKVLNIFREHINK